jgi:hypothetical protein
VSASKDETWIITNTVNNSVLSYKIMRVSIASNDDQKDFRDENS